MRKFRKIAAMGLVIAIVAALYVSLADVHKDIASNSPASVKGELNLSDWNFAEQGIVPLDGEWTFYPGRFVPPQADQPASGTQTAGFVTVPNHWEKYAIDGQAVPAIGYGTYRLRVHLPQDENVGILGIYVKNVKSAHRIFVNGQEVGSSGEPGTNMEETFSQNRPYISFIPSQGKSLDIVIHAANFRFYTGGISASILLGEQFQILRQREFERSLDWAVVISTMLLGAYFTVMYTMRKKERAWLYFGMFCLAGALYALATGEKLLYTIFPNAPYEIYNKVLFGAGAVATYFLMRYTQDSFRTIFHVAIRKTIEWIVIAWLALILFTPVIFYSRFEFMYGGAVLIVAYLIYVLAVGVWKRMEGSIYMMGSVVFILGAIISMPFKVFGLKEQPQFVALSILGFLVSHLLLLSTRFTRSFSMVETMSDRLVAMDRLKDEFLANTTHEMRTPLHGVINIAQSLLEGAAGKLTPKQEENMTLIMSTGKRMSNLIDDILDLSKLRNGDVSLNRQPAALRPIVEVVFGMFHYLAAGKAIRLKNLLPEKDLYAFADEDRLTQVLYNLIGNAVKFTAEGEIAVSAKLEDGWVRISVTDTGIGIPQSRLEAIFEAYEQAGSAISREYGGTGLGLSISRKIVELHGGQITVESAEGQGSTFSFTLPAATGDENLLGNRVSGPMKRLYERSAGGAEQASRKIVNKQTGDYGILVVDDDAANRQVLVNLLSVDGYSVTAVASGAEALLEIDRAPLPDLVIVDLMMPGMSGYDVCRRIRERFTLSELPIVMLTARSWQEDMYAGFDSGANDFLGKPVDAGELKARVRTLLEMKRSASEKVRMEMAFLQAQIKPHFLFNTLNTILSVSFRDVGEAQELLEVLSSYLRGSFDFHNRERFVPIGRELELVDAYLFIEKARFRERLTIYYDIEDGIDCLVPPLTIQPIVENAVRHGATKRAEGGEVRIRIRKETDEIVVEVADDGPGIPESKLASFRSGGPAIGGVGLANIERRLMAIYGTGLEMESKPGSGTCIRFRMRMEARKPI